MNPSRSHPGGEARVATSAARLSCRVPSTERLLLPGVRVFDPRSGLDRPADLLLDEGRVAALDPPAGRTAGARRLEDVAGCTVFPGFVDIHTHLRTPGHEYKEDLASGTAAAAAGGYVLVVNMANTDPVVDNGAVAGWVLDAAGREARVMVGQVGAVTKGQRGEELAELWELYDAGVVAFSDDGRPIEGSDVLLHALRYLRGSDRPLLLHIEDRRLAGGGSMHEGRWSARLGLRGMPALSESLPLAQALDVLAYATEEAAHVGADPVAVHVQHVSTAESVALLRKAVGEGLPVSAEATPHHLLLTDERVQTFDQNLKMNPPLRDEDDRQALVEGLAEGTIACVATDHAPHAPHEKEVPFEEAPFGTVGLESAFPALYRGLVTEGDLSLERLVDAMSAAPCRVLGLDPPAVAEGAPANLCVIDLDEEWPFGRGDLRGKSRNSAFLGQRVQGRVRLTVVGGGIVWHADGRAVPGAGAP